VWAQVVELLSSNPRKEKKKKRPTRNILRQAEFKKEMI
jgi:hypothetical protein